MNPIPLAANSLLAPILERLPWSVAFSSCAYVAPCPLQHEERCWLALAETAAGVAIACVGNCRPAAVVLSLGLSVDDLFPESSRPATSRERAEALQCANDSEFVAADQVIHASNAVLLEAARKLGTVEGLTLEEEARVTVAREIGRQLMEWRP